MNDPDGFKPITKNTVINPDAPVSAASITGATTAAVTGFYSAKLNLHGDASGGRA